VTAEGGANWCAVQFWLGMLAVVASDLTVGFGHVTAVRDALAGGAPTPMLARALAWRSLCLTYLGRLPEAAAEGRQALAMARELEDQEGEAYALVWLGQCAMYAGDMKASLAWLRQQQRLDRAAVPGWIVRQGAVLMAIALPDVGEVADAQRCCEDALSMARQAGALPDQGELLRVMADL